MWVANSFDLAPVSGVNIVSPPLPLYEALVQVHDPEYVAAVKTGTPCGLAEGLWISTA